MSSAPDPSGDAASPEVVAVVLARGPSALAEGLDALSHQVYGPFEGIVVGGGEAVRDVAVGFGVEWAATVAEALGAVEPRVTYVWFVDSRARARPDALGALVAEAQRVDAAVAGSKVLRADDPQVLESVGLATDVFDHPYTGLEPDERDQSQYDVVRDVAAVPVVSVLVRRDLLLGLRGPDLQLANEAAGIDFCQRARLRGARVVVVPSSEVLFPSALRRSTHWREEAGRIRAMLKSYSLLTLAWALPLVMLVGLIEVIVGPLVGRFTLVAFVRAWGWNLFRLPSTVLARWHARRRRSAGDEELFRFQVRGSVKLRILWSDLVERIHDRVRVGRVGGIGALLESTQDALRSPGFLSAAAGVLFVFAATRSIWSGRLPAVGFALPPSPAALDTLRAYAGGWNPAGLGTTWPLRPAVGVVALFQAAVLDRPELTATVLTIAALVAAVIGMARLLRSWGFGAAAGYVGGVVLIAGPATAALASRTHWTVLLALGPLVWVMRLALRPWPAAWRGRAGRIAALGALSALAAAGLPPLLVVPAALLALWAVLGEGSRWWAVVRAGLAAALAIPVLFPWFGVVDLYDYLEFGQPAFWRPPWLAVIAIGLCAGGAIVAGPRLFALVGGWGGALAAGGTALARTGDLGWGREVEATGLVIAAIGSAVVVAAAIEAAGHLRYVAGWRRLAGWSGVVAALLVAASTLALMVPGRAGLPEDEFRSGLAFTTLGSSEPQQSRVLMLGEGDQLPGEARSFAGVSYRLVSAPVPRLDEAWLGPVHLGDTELEAVLASMAEGEVARAGERLADFGIRWVVFAGPNLLDALFEGQLDLVPLPGLSGRVFVNEAPAGRAVASDGSFWNWDPAGYRGAPLAGGTVRIAENADRRWGPEPWSQEGWANRVAADTGEVSFAGRPAMRRQAVTAGAVLGLLVLVALAGLGRKAR